MNRRTQGIDRGGQSGKTWLGALALVVVITGCNCGDISGDPDGGKGGGNGTGGSSGTGGGSGNGGGNGNGGGTGGGFMVPTDGGCGLTATIRDFRKDHPDFENVIADDRGIVRADLGVDKKPQYAPVTHSPTTSGRGNFDQWYRDTPSVNQTTKVPLPLTNPGPGQFIFDSAAFFPIDGILFGNEGNDHNFHFTTELHATFQYKGGEKFTFRGDDDVWIFVNNKLALDLGGVHGVQSATIDFDALASQLGITQGNTYSFDAFHAERHTTESNFRIETSIECFVDVVIN